MDLENSLEVDLENTIGVGFGKYTRSGFGKYSVSNRPTGCLIMIDIKYELIAQTKKHHWS